MSLKPILSEAQKKKALEDYNNALKFTLETHQSDLERIDSLNGLMTDFDKFFYEYVYVVCASGFRAHVAARLTPQLVACKGDQDKMSQIFKNARKTESIAKVWAQRDEWEKLRSTFTDVDQLTKLPYIGEITKYHLGRNIGLLSHAKPDLHLCRWCETINGNDSEENVGLVIDELAKEVGKKPGTVDFALWVWLSHDRGVERDCCHGGYALR